MHLSLRKQVRCKNKAKVSTLALFLHCKIINLTAKRVFDSKTKQILLLRPCPRKHFDTPISIIQFGYKKGVFSSSTGSSHSKLQIGTAVNANGLLFT